jgi:transposase
MFIAVKKDSKLNYGSISKVANMIGVNRATISRWIKSGDRVVYKNGFEILLKVEKL